MWDGKDKCWDELIQLIWERQQQAAPNHTWLLDGDLFHVAINCKMLQDVVRCCKMLQDVARCWNMLQHRIESILYILKKSWKIVYSILRKMSGNVFYFPKTFIICIMFLPWTRLNDKLLSALSEAQILQKNLFLILESLVSRSPLLGSMCKPKGYHTHSMIKIQLFVIMSKWGWIGKTSIAY